jgi:hypothetical protein
MLRGSAMYAVRSLDTGMEETEPQQEYCGCTQGFQIVFAAWCGWRQLHDPDRLALLEIPRTKY